MRYAVIDLGTNTCNLLIAEVMGKKSTILHQSKKLVRLGDDRITANLLSEQAMERTIAAFNAHRQFIQKYNAEKVHVIATSAVRGATNSQIFIEKINSGFNWDFEIISGEREAELIFKGILLAFGQLETPGIILDIGGGSNEIIIAEKDKLIWKESQPAGMARVINQFDLSNPVTARELKVLKNYFSEIHRNAMEQIKALNIKRMIGCSGAFDTIADVVEKVDPGERKRVTQKIGTDDFFRIHHQIIGSTLEERMKMKGMDPVRVELIVPAMILIETIVSSSGITEIIQTDYALREGVLYEIINSNYPK